MAYSNYLVMKKEDFNEELVDLACYKQKTNIIGSVLYINICMLLSSI